MAAVLGLAKQAVIAVGKVIVNQTDTSDDASQIDQNGSTSPKNNQRNNNAPLFSLITIQRNSKVTNNPNLSPGQMHRSASDSNLTKGDCCQNNQVVRKKSFNCSTANEEFDRRNLRPSRCTMRNEDQNNMENFHEHGCENLSVRRATSAGSSVTWSWQDDNGTWIQYGNMNNDGFSKASLTSDEIESTYQRNENGVMSFRSSSGLQYLLDFRQMIQENVQTNKSRPIRRSHSQMETNITEEFQDMNFGVSVAPVKWFWQHESASWVEYGNNSFVTSDELEKLFQENPNGMQDRRAPNGAVYMINFADMSQINLQSNVRRRIKRGQ